MWVEDSGPWWAEVWGGALDGALDGVWVAVWGGALDGCLVVAWGRS